MTFLSVVVVAFALLGFGWLGLRRPFLPVFLGLPAASMILRVLSSLYIDTAGPIDSIQMFRSVGPGGSATFLVLADVCFLLPILITFSPALAARLIDIDPSAPRPSERWGPVRRNVALVLFGTFVVALYVDMFRKGVVPLLSGMERWVYQEEYAGVLHAAQTKYGVILAFAMGLFFAVPWLRKGVPDRPFLGLLIAIFVYLLLAGNRFSGFVGRGAIFAMPVGLVLLKGYVLRSRGMARTTVQKRSRLTTSLNLGAIVLSVVIVAFGLYYSYVFTRVEESGLAWVSFANRVAVQPGEMWWTTYERVFLGGGARPEEAFDRVFVHPIVDPVRNSSIPYLMVAEIGSKAYEMLDLGLAWGGGFPEIAFELAGVGGGFLLLLAMGAGLAVTLYGLFYLVARERYLSALLMFYVAYAFILFPLAGMLNFLVNWKYWVKVGAAFSWITAESVVLSQQRRARTAGGTAQAPEPSLSPV